VGLESLGIEPKEVNFWYGSVCGELEFKGITQREICVQNDWASVYKSVGRALTRPKDSKFPVQMIGP
jgi:hypothetical protein